MLHTTSEVAEWLRGRASEIRRVRISMRASASPVSDWPTDPNNAEANAASWPTNGLGGEK